MQRTMRVIAVAILFVIPSVSFAGSRSVAASERITIDVFLSGNELYERSGNTGCDSKSALGDPEVIVGDASADLEAGEFRGLDDSPTGRTGCFFSVSLTVREAGPFEVMVGDADVGRVTASQLERLDNHLEVAIRTADFIVDSEGWRFPNSEEEASSRETAQFRQTPAPASGRTRDTWGCADLEDYQSERYSLLLSVENYEAVETLLETDDFTTLRPSVARRASDGLDEWAGLLEEMDDVPKAAEEYHEAFIDLISTMSSMLVSYAEGGILAAAAYGDAADAATDSLDAAEQLGERRCGDAWTDAFGG
jgi:hypothetical protein